MGDNEQANAEVIAEATAGPAGADQAVAAAELRAVRNLELKAVLLLVVFVLMLGAAAAYLLYARGVFEPKQTVILMTDDAEGVIPGAQQTVRELNGLLVDARDSLKKVDKVLADATVISGNAKDASSDLGALRSEVDASLRKVDRLISELNRKWPFAPKPQEVKLP